MFNKFSFVFYLFLLFTLKTNAQPHILPIIGTGKNSKGYDVLLTCDCCNSVMDFASFIFLAAFSLGTCFAGRKFVIQSIFDLRNNVNDLECIFAGALAPDAIGLGFYYGTVLLKDNSCKPRYNMNQVCIAIEANFHLLLFSGFSCCFRSLLPRRLCRTK